MGDIEHRLRRKPASTPGVALLAALFLGTGSIAMAGSLGGPLELADEGSFFVGGQPATSSHPGTPAVGAAQPGQITIKQMYVQYRIPKTVSGPPIVMVHGSGHTGATFETTPDGREGWATYFARKGFPVYVVDHAGRGRSGFDPTPFNRARAGEADAKSLPDLQIAPRERAWWFFRIGAKYPEPFPGSQFPVEAFDHYTAQLVPNAEATLAGRRRQHREGARRAARQDRSRRRAGAFAVRRLRDGPRAGSAPHACSASSMSKAPARRSTRKRSRRSSRMCRCSRCGATTARARPAPTATTAATAAPPRSRQSRTRAAPPNSCCCPRPASRATAT